jgi:hypothetical protein
MATNQISSAAPVARPSIANASGLSRFLNQYFYFSMSLLVAVVVASGFGHTVDGHLIHATPRRPWLLWVHGFVFSGWVLFFIFQSAMVRMHNVKLHRTMGWFGAGLGAVIPVLGISTALVMDRFEVATLHAPKDAYTFFAIQFLDISSFTAAFWLAVLWRRRPEMHRRLVLIATCTLTGAAFVRIPHLALPPYLGPYWWVDALILLGVGRDLIVNGKVNVVYRYALPLLVVWQAFMVYLAFQHPAWWIKFTETIMG